MDGKCIQDRQQIYPKVTMKYSLKSNFRAPQLLSRLTIISSELAHYVMATGKLPVLVSPLQTQLFILLTTIIAKTSPLVT